MAQGKNLDAEPRREATEVLMIHLLRSELYKRFPILRKKVSRPNLARPVRDGHYGGKLDDGTMKKATATDIYLDATIDEEKSIGDALFAQLVAARKMLGIKYVIWNAEKSTLRGDFVTYKIPPGKPQNATWRHANHLHVEFDAKEGDKDHSDWLMIVLDSI